jgi:hypothetical protein
MKKKYTFINNKIFSTNTNKNDLQPNFNNIHNCKKALKKISKMVFLDVFSADVIHTETNYFIIDINPAPSLRSSLASRKAFIEFICKLRVS